MSYRFSIGRLGYSCNTMNNAYSNARMVSGMMMIEARATCARDVRFVSQKYRVSVIGSEPKYSSSDSADLATSNAWSRRLSDDLDVLFADAAALDRRELLEQLMKIVIALILDARFV